MVLSVNVLSLRGLKLFSHVTWLGTGQFRWSIGTNGTIGTNKKAHLCKTSSPLHQVKC